MPGPTLHPLLRRSLRAGATAGFAFATARFMGQPLTKQDGRLLDWDAARHTAHGRTGEQPQRFAPEIGARYDAIANELAGAVAEVTQEAPSGFPAFQVIDRRGFIDANLEIAQRLTGPVEELRATLPESRATALGRVGMSRYLGEMFGFISKRVLGQYDPVLSLSGEAPAARPALYLVEPNVRSFEERSGAPGEDLRRWLILHELTHAWQFGQHPWLAEHLTTLMRELVLDSLVRRLAAEGKSGAKGSGNGSSRKGFSLDTTLRTLPGELRTQLRAMGRVQAVMSVLEGHSNFVMHQAGRRHINNFDRLEDAFHRRADERSAIERLVLVATGMNVKLRQYEVGEKFCDGVTAVGGLGLLNRVWEGPEMMPSPAELKNPQLWVARAR
ncbi:MAG: zinc-dependent metalloprotease [Candidatus Dormibacteria bacterium]